MGNLPFDTVIKQLATTRLTRLTALRGLVASAATLTGAGLLGEATGAKGGHGHKTHRSENKIRLCVCQSGDVTTCTGQKKATTKAKKILKRNACAYRGRCQSGVSGCALAVNFPFTVSACWSVVADHDTYLFVPQAGTDDPSPFIDYSCNPDDDCATGYPFACVGESIYGEPGCEVTTVHQRLGGLYEYWIEVDSATPAGEVTVTLRNSGETVLATWSSPANSSGSDRGWHVFDVDGSTGGVTSVDQFGPLGNLVDNVHQPNTRVCGGQVL